MTLFQILERKIHHVVERTKKHTAFFIMHCAANMHMLVTQNKTKVNYRAFELGAYITLLNNYMMVFCQRKRLQLFKL